VDDKLCPRHRVASRSLTDLAGASGRDDWTRTSLRVLSPRPGQSSKRPTVEDEADSSARRIPSSGPSGAPTCVKPERAWTFCNDPGRVWVRGTRAGQLAYARLPLTSVTEEDT
jgi:hypothetical protein